MGTLILRKNSRFHLKIADSIAKDASAVKCYSSSIQSARVNSNRHFSLIFARKLVLSQEKSIGTPPI